MARSLRQSIVSLQVFLLVLVPLAATLLPLLAPTPAMSGVVVAKSSSPAATPPLVDDRDPWVEGAFCPGGPCPPTGFKRSGPPEKWQSNSRPSDKMWGTSALWLRGVLNSQDSLNAAMWAAVLGTGQAEWEVLAYIPKMITGMADTKAAHYCVGGSVKPPFRGHEGFSQPHSIVCEYPRTIDQAAAVGHWVSLGTYTYVPDFEIVYGTVTLGDWVGDASLPASVLFDAVKWVKVEPDGADVTIDAFLRAGPDGPRVADGTTFDVGDPIALCAEVPRTAFVEIDVCLPSSSCSTESGPTSDEWCRTGTVGGTSGRRDVTARAKDPTTRQLWDSAETFYLVKGAAPTATAMRPVATATPLPSATSSPSVPAPTVPPTTALPSPTATRRFPTAPPTATPTPELGICSSAGGDSDRDGLCSDWERAGYQSVDLPGMGADPSRPDIFVELDYVAGFRPKPDFIPLVEEAFTAQGIGLHIDLDDRFGSNGKSNPVRGYGGRVARQDFQTIKEYNFGRNRRGLFHYALAVGSWSTGKLGDFLGLDDWLGKGEHRNGNPDSVLEGALGDDLVMAVGRISELSEVPLVTQAAIFMHELGHNLGLAHGRPFAGRASELEQAKLVNKPNHLSVMNYVLAFRGLEYQGAPGHLDYTHYGLPALEEAALDESQGLGNDPRIAAYGTRYYCPGQRDWGATGRAVSASGMIDWNCDGHIDTSVRTDINGDGKLTQLASFPEWGALVFTGGDIGATGRSGIAFMSSSSPGQSQEEIDLQEPPLAVLDQQRSLYWVRVLGQGVRSVTAPGPLEVPFTVRNQGDLPDSYRLTASATNEHVEILVAPGEVRLQPGEERTVSVLARVRRVPIESEAAWLKLSAQSSQAPRIADVSYVSIIGRSRIAVFLPATLDGTLATIGTGVPPATSAAPTLTATPKPPATAAPLTTLGSLPTLPSECVVQDGRFAFVGSGSSVAVVDVARPQSPAVVATIPKIGCPLAVADAHLFGASGRAVRVIDVSSLPTAFIDLGIRHSEGVIAVYGLSAIGVSGTKIIASEGRNVVRVFERSDPLLTRPTGHTVLGSVMETLAYGATGLVVANVDKGLAFVSETDEVHVKDVPGNPVGLCAPGGFVQSAASPFFVASTGFGVLRILGDVVDNRLDTPGDPRALDCDDNRVYVIDRQTSSPSHVLVLDVNLNPIASSSTSGEGRDIAVMNRLVLLADGVDGLKVLANAP